MTTVFAKSCRSLLLMAALAWGLCPPAPAESEATAYLRGRVVAVHQPQQEFILALSPEEATAEPAGGQTLTVRLATDAEQPRLPCCVEEGAQVRVQGHFSDIDRSLFLAVAIRGVRGCQNDMTGVRSRLDRGMGRRCRGAADCRRPAEGQDRPPATGNDDRQ